MALVFKKARKLLPINLDLLNLVIISSVNYFSRMAKNLKTSIFAPKQNPEIFEIEGAVFSSTNCGLYKHKDDLTLIHFPSGASVGGAFTRSLMASPPVLKCRENLKNGNAFALVVNSGNSLAMTGTQGAKTVEEIISGVASVLNVEKNGVFISSTGVIGQLFASEKITKSLPKLKESLAKDSILQTAKTIMTTDTFPKIASIQTEIDGQTVAITGIAKGSGMIEPNMATMLAYIFTDACISSTILQKLVEKYLENSFNSITVDSDTSTSDSLIAFATNKIHHKEINAIEDRHFQHFCTAFESIMQSLAKQIIQDGEGISKFITINVFGGETEKSAKIVGKAIANSPLVKTAIAGCDPNWGRIAAAVGKTSEKVHLHKFSVSIGGFTIYENEGISPHYKEEDVYKYLQGSEVEISVGLGVGNAKSTVWTCDLTHGYIDINTDYRS